MSSHCEYKIICRGVAEQEGVSWGEGRGETVSPNKKFRVKPSTPALPKLLQMQYRINLANI